MTKRMINLRKNPEYLLRYYIFWTLYSIELIHSFVSSLIIKRRIRRPTEYSNMSNTRWQTNRQQCRLGGRNQKKYESLRTKQSNISLLKDTIELFVDRQRQAAVVLGVRDIAGDVQAKKRRDRWPPWPRRNQSLFYFNFQQMKWAFLHF